jgi:S1-C subfamily serine protease
MSDDWYVRKGPKTLGPLTEVELRHVLETGRIGPDTPVRHGTDGAWTPAGQALSDAKRDKARAPSKTKSRTPLVIAGGVLVAVLVAGLWAAFGVSRRHPHRDVAAAPPDDASEANAVAASGAAIETPIVRNAEAPSALKSPQSPAATQPSPSTAGASLAAAAHTRASLRAPRVKPAKDLGPKSAPHPPPKPEAAKPKVFVVKVAPVVVPKAPATQTDLRALETTALRSWTAKDALALYNAFKATRTISPSAEDLFKENLRVWEDRARQDLVRLGDQWVDAAEAAKPHAEAAGLFLQAHEMTKNLKFDEARKTLEAESRVDPNSIAADFTLGLLCSITPPKFRSPHAAVKHFQIVLQRLPGYVPALNNLALAEIREEKYAEALEHLREAADRSPASEEVTQNLGRFISEAQLGRIHPSPSVLSEATNLYSRIVTAKAGAEQRHGWHYLPLVLPKEEREVRARVPAPEADSTTVVAQGTGLVVAPHYVLASRHLVDDPTLGRADKIEVIDPTDANHQRRLPATCVDVGEDDDLCLLRCDSLNAPPISLADQVPPRGSQVLLIGFPPGSGAGLRSKTSRGLVTALAGDVARTGGPKWSDFSRKLWYDAAPSHATTTDAGPIEANSTGAVCDEGGHVVALHSTLFRPGNDPSNMTYGGGVPAPNAATFLRHSVPSLAHPSLGGPALKWTAVEAKASASIVLVVVSYRKVTMVMSEKADASPLTRAVRQATDDIYDDRFCSVCNGRVRVRCRAPGCPYAGLHDETSLNEAISTPKTSARRVCPACLNTGYVRCPNCSIGIDPLLR